ncbi:MAG: GNAT family protein [Dehalococcoidia bacterium]
MAEYKDYPATRPNFQSPVLKEFTGYNSKKQYRLISIDNGFEVSGNDLQTITDICNEELVYRFLFQDRLKGKAYKNNDAHKFIIWAKDCWKKDISYFFFIRDQNNNIVACTDIGSSNLKEAPIGYWATMHSPGVMTNAVKCLITVARKAGYKKLYALVEPVNIKSIGVVQRTGFTYTGTKMEGLLFMDKPVGTKKLFNRYEKVL